MSELKEKAVMCVNNTKTNKKINTMKLYIMTKY